MASDKFCDESAYVWLHRNDGNPAESVSSFPVGQPADDNVGEPGVDPLGIGELAVQSKKH